MNPANAFLADAIVSVHFLFVAFCVSGEAAILLGALVLITLIFIRPRLKNRPRRARE